MRELYQENYTSVVVLCCFVVCMCMCIWVGFVMYVFVKVL